MSTKAEAKKPGGKTPAKGGEVELRKSTAVGAPINYEQDAGAGLEGADKDSFAIPFLVVLQPLSPAIVEGLVEGARPGMLMNSVTNELYGADLGKDSQRLQAYFIPCAFQRRWVRWAPRETGGGFKGEFSTAQVAEIRAKSEVKELEGRLYYPLPDGTINEKKCDKLMDTRSHFGLLLSEPESELAVPIVMALASTSIKSSKNLLSRIEGIKFKRQNGSPYTPPSFSHLYGINVVKKTNDKGTWYMPEFTQCGALKSEATYELAKAFYSRVVEGKVDVAHDSLRTAGTMGAEESGAGDGF